MSKKNNLHSEPFCVMFSIEYLLHNAILNEIITMPNGNVLYSIWIRLVALAGTFFDKKNYNVAPIIPGDLNTIAQSITVEVELLTTALELFKLNGLISETESGFSINSWDSFWDLKGEQKLERGRANAKRSYEKNKKKKTEAVDVFKKVEEGIPSTKESPKTENAAKVVAKKVKNTANQKDSKPEHSIRNKTLGEKRAYVDVVHCKVEMRPQSNQTFNINFQLKNKDKEVYISAQSKK